MKLFKTTSMEIIQLCQTYLCFEFPSVLLKIELKILERSAMNIIILATIDKLCKLVKIFCLFLCCNFPFIFFAVVR